MRKIQKLFAVCALCAGAFLAIPKTSLGETIDQTYDQCMSWCMVQYDFFTCDSYCSRYPSEEI
jgi:hypothetical protein